MANSEEIEAWVKRVVPEGTDTNKICMMQSLTSRQVAFTYHPGDALPHEEDNFYFLFEKDEWHIKLMARGFEMFTQYSETIYFVALEW